MKEGKEQKRKSQKTYEREAARKKGQKTEWKDSKNERKTAIEPRTSLLHDVPDMINEFEKKNDQQLFNLKIKDGNILIYKEWR